MKDIMQNIHSIFQYLTEKPFPDPKQRLALLHAYTMLFHSACLFSILHLQHRLLHNTVSNSDNTEKDSKTEVYSVN